MLMLLGLGLLGLLLALLVGLGCIGLLGLACWFAGWLVDTSPEQARWPADLTGPRAVQVPGVQVPRWVPSTRSTRYRTHAHRSLAKSRGKRV